MRLLRFICLVFTVSAVITAQARAEMYMDNVVGLWLFDEGEGEVVNDQSSHENHGTFNGTPEWVEGIVGGALNCARQGHVLIKDNDSLDLDGAWTLTLWVNINPPMERWQTILNKRFDTATNYVIRLQDVGKWEVMVNNGSWVRVGDPSPAQGGEWVHLAGVYNGEDTLSLFVDGKQVATRSGIAPPPVNEIDLRLGSYSGNGGGIDGMMDETAIFNVALEPDDILSIREEGLALALDLSGAGLAKARSPNPKNGAIHEDTWVTLSWKPGGSAISHDVYFGDDFSSVDYAARDSDLFRGNQMATFYVAGFPGFAYPDGLVAGTTYYWRIDEVNDADPNSPWKGNIWSFSIPPKTAYNPDPADGTEFVGPEGITLRWTPGFGAIVHTLYLGDNYDEISNATVGIPVGGTTYRPGPLESEKVYYWRVDEFDGVATYKGDIWGFTTPGAAGAPQPADGAVDVEQIRILNWTPADNANSHHVYFGMDKEAVKNATPDSPEYKGNKARGSESYDPGKLAWYTSYYWRVDAVYNANQDQPTKGLVWSFTTINFFLIDDFESYTDDDAAGQAIWQTWVDGFGVADNGAQIGYLLPPYAEQTIVHDGGQSMPLLYVNEEGIANSEASLILESDRDWTAEDVGELSLWFRGRSANAPEPFYVAISNDVGVPAVVVHDDSIAANAGTWRQWRITLHALVDQGINLTNVDKLTIGLGSKGGPAVGGSGTMYIDDIRLYRLRNAP
ncbi:LamG-like jellyroll fold domain-containing protein [Planctomycetota bacterium]